jgi:hypothetical protein
MLAFTVISLLIPAQDTIRLEPSIHYSSKLYPYTGKDFAFKARYAREDIVFSDTRKEIDYCYYYDSLRNCRQYYYELTNDSTLTINNCNWNYRKEGNSFFVYRYIDGVYESGYAKTLIPFETTGLFTTTTADKIDTLWATDYATDEPSNPCNRPTYFFYKAPITGKIYPQNKIDEPCTLPNGAELPVIYLKRNDVCYGEPLYKVRTMKFIVTKEGRIVNIEQSQGNIDISFCPGYILELTKYIKQWGTLIPARRKGKNVNVAWTVAVDMCDSL